MGKIIKYKKLLLYLLILMFLFIGQTILAEESKGTTTLVTWPDSPISHTPFSGLSELHELVLYVYEWGLTLGGLALFVVLIYAGMEYLTSTGKPEIMRSAKDRIKNGVIGLILLLSIWLIFYTISPELVNIEPLDFNLKSAVTCDEEEGGDEYCKANFGESFKCVNGFCTLDMEEFKEALRPKTCKWLKVTTTLEDGSVFERTLYPNGDKQAAPYGNFIIPGTEIVLEAKLEEDDQMCIAVFDMYEGFLATRCAGQSHSHFVTVSREGENDTKTESFEFHKVIKCVGHSASDIAW